MLLKAEISIRTDVRNREVEWITSISEKLKARRLTYAANMYCTIRYDISEISIRKETYG